MAVAAASLRMVMFSMSEGFSADIGSTLLLLVEELPSFSAFTGTPSITYNGAVPELSDPRPRTKTLPNVPGILVALFICTPGTAPSSDFMKLASVFLFKASLSTMAAAPVNEARRWVV